MTTKDNTRIVALIERAERQTPYCDCGEPTAAMANDRQIWLSCTAHPNPLEAGSAGSSPRSRPRGTLAS
jgi:hypothetical protein